MKNLDIRQPALPIANPVACAGHIALPFHEALADIDPGDVYSKALNSAPRMRLDVHPTAPFPANRCPLGNLVN